MLHHFLIVFAVFPLPKPPRLWAGPCHCILRIFKRFLTHFSCFQHSYFHFRTLNFLENLHVWALRCQLNHFTTLKVSSESSNLDMFLSAGMMAWPRDWGALDCKHNSTGFTQGRSTKRACFFRRGNGLFKSRRALGPAHRRGGRGLQEQFDRFPLGSQLKII